jgi:hypothetical protein
VERLKAIGQWLGHFGTSVYGTRGGPVPPRSWGVTTQRGDTVFVHVLDWPDRMLSLPDLGARVKTATMLRDGARVPVTQSESGVTLTLPTAEADEVDRVVVLETISRTRREARSRLSLGPHRDHATVRARRIVHGWHLGGAVVDLDARHLLLPHQPTTAD